AELLYHRRLRHIGERVQPLGSCAPGLTMRLFQQTGAGPIVELSVCDTGQAAHLGRSVTLDGLVGDVHGLPLLCRRGWFACVDPRPPAAYSSVIPNVSER